MNDYSRASDLDLPVICLLKEGIDLTVEALVDRIAAKKNSLLPDNIGNVAVIFFKIFLAGLFERALDINYLHSAFLNLFVSHHNNRITSNIVLYSFIDPSFQFCFITLVHRVYFT